MDCFLSTGINLKAMLHFPWILQRSRKGLADLYPSDQSVTMRLLVEVLGINALQDFFLSRCLFFGYTQRVS